MLDKWEQALEDITEADRIKFNRLVLENDELQRKLSELTLDFGFPLATLQDAICWISQQVEQAKTILKPGERMYYGPPRDDISPEENRHTEIGRLTEEINELMRKYSIPFKWWTYLFYRVILAENSKSGPRFNGGFPTVRFDMATGKQTFTGIEDVDINNPLVVDFINRIKRSNLKRDEVPRPLPTGNRNELDWRPVQEWFLCHSEMTKKEKYTFIGEKLGYSPGYVKKKLSEFDGR